MASVHEGVLDGFAGEEGEEGKRIRIYFTELIFYIDYWYMYVIIGNALRRVQAARVGGRKLRCALFAELSLSLLLLCTVLVSYHRKRS